MATAKIAESAKYGRERTRHAIRYISLRKRTRSQRHLHEDQPFDMTRSVLRNATMGLLGSAVVFALILSGCDAFSNDRDVTGRVQVLITDNPLDDFAEANVTIRRVELLGVDGSGESMLYVLTDTPQEFNLLDLRNGVTAPLAEADIPVGRYNQVRVVVDEEARVHMVNGESHILKVPSGAQSGIKINFPHFEISSDDDLITLTVDFDVEDSFVRAGSSGMYIFKPVVKAHAMIVNGDEQDVEATD
jgi:hypothetical protein